MSRTDPPLYLGQLSGLRILVVEDDTDSREMLCEVLTLYGATCDVAPDVPTARAKLASTGIPDVVVSDIGMPNEDGYALSRWVRANSSAPNLPLIALTAMDDREATRAAGFVAHVTKPIKIVELLEAIEQVLSSKHQSEA